MGYKGRDTKQSIKRGMSKGRGCSKGEKGGFFVYRKR